jgi:hypothetical protein
MDPALTDLLISVLREAGVVEEEESVGSSQFEEKFTDLLGVIEDLKAAKGQSSRNRILLSQKQTELEEMEAQLEEKNRRD